MKLNKKVSFIMLLCVLVFAMIPMVAAAATLSNTATGQGNLYTSGKIANLHGGDLVLKNVNTGVAVFTQHFRPTLSGSVEVISLDGGVVSNLPYGAYQLTWSGTFGGTIKIQF
ncbi:hypothetical protein [Paenibacillus sp. J22TS3]|uniref:hypothetical protein n=1 Tax=Paenibacillus sp. J22TS3 TaxID=2807192 RepID=UPI001B208E34|nr:hypothetical protein [Paenibacillus sp. J22TS3]GIP20055.1 hypothetical protein J22TS3_03300 [Paenibacillus sp. J22TS3]